MSQQIATVFDCEGAKLVGIAEVPATPCRTAVLVVTGGPQYRVGSHRQFALLCRKLATQDIASLRFDFRGSGDSDGPAVSFTALQADIAAAIDELCKRVPRATRIVMVGLCDAASAILMNACADARVTGLVLLNPWVRTTGSLEQARVRGYYPSRIVSPAFWKRLLTGKVSIIKSLMSFREQVAAAGDRETASSAEDEFLGRMLDGARGFRGRILVVLSGQDMTAQEYRDLLAASPQWRSEMSADNVEQVEVTGANHTFANAAWRDAVAGHTLEFIQALDRG